jgi:YfiH family protein
MTVWRAAVYAAPGFGRGSSEADARAVRLREHAEKWLGRAIGGRAVPTCAPTGWVRDEVDAITVAARSYGFHGTLKPPFRLAAGRSLDELTGAVADLAARTPAVSIPHLSLGRLDAFFALVPGADDQPLRSVADAVVTDRPGLVLSVLTADCLPVMFADDRGRAVGVAHAGWRGLSAGVLERTVEAMRALLPAGAVLQAWMGPAIGPSAFEVGDEVLEAFVSQDPGAREAFAPGVRPGKWQADLYRLARRRLRAAGVARIDGGGFCTFTDSGRFWSYRRRAESGRMASLIWIAG